MQNDSATIKELLDSIDIESFLDREGIEYRANQGSRGPQFNVKTCPVCGNSSWKVYLNQETGLGNCFAGDHPPGKGFNKWSFISSSLGTNAGSVVKYLSTLAGSMGWKPARKTIVAVDNNSTDFQLPKSYPLPINGLNLKYLSNRGISSEMCKYFRLSFSKSGVYRYRYINEWRFQDYSNRIIIPIYDLDSKLVTFQGRDITGKADKKYLFPPGLSSSGTHLYNGFNVHDTKRIVVGEGVFDVIALKMALDQEPGLRDVTPVGTFGKHLSYGSEHDQMDKFMILKQRGVEEITFMWDGEQLATDEAVNKGQLLMGQGFKVKIAMLPEGKDPNEITAEELRATFYRAIPLNSKTAIQIKLALRK